MFNVFINQLSINLSIDHSIYESIYNSILLAFYSDLGTSIGLVLNMAFLRNDSLTSIITAKLNLHVLGKTNNPQMQINKNIACVVDTSYGFFPFKSSNFNDLVLQKLKVQYFKSAR